MNKLENEKLIIEKTRDNLILVYFNPKNWRKNKKQQSVFDCDKYISILPPGHEESIEISDKPHPDTGKITDTIIHEDNFHAKKEGLPIVFGRIFQ